MCWSLFLIKLQAYACNFIKKIVQHRGFPVNITKFLRALILKNICERLLLTTKRCLCKNKKYQLPHILKIDMKKEFVFFKMKLSF